MKKPYLALCCLGLLTPAAAAGPVDYLRDVKPILAQHCVACHGPQKQKSGLRLDTAALLRKGGNAGPAVVPGKSAASPLVLAVTGGGDFQRMPPKEPRLTAAQVATLRAWIDQGATAPATENAAAAAGPASKHWAFQKPARPPLPPVRQAEWLRNPIDRFILARLEKEGLAPSPSAGRATLIRRLSLDLTGLPPSPAEVDAFVNDPRPDAYEHLVDRLLASPHYGERWGRHWLDLARYADSNGFTIDGPRPIWKYRDWVINALNRDLPFDRFTIEQLAGDLLPNATAEQRIATGFHRNTLRNEEGGIDLEQFRVESVVDRVNTTGAVFLGLTVGCAQCHDHKYDPIAQREYYQLFAFLNNADEPTLELPTPEQARARAEVRAGLKELQRKQKLLETYSPEKEDRWEKSLSLEQRMRLPKDIQGIFLVAENGRTPRQKQRVTSYYRQLDFVRHVLGGLGNPPLAAAHMQALRFRTQVDRQIATLKRREPQIVSTLVMAERKTPRESYVHIAGDFTRKGATVTPDVPAVLHPLRSHRAQPVGSANRLDLARWLVDPDNPLTPRVAVNRFWQHYFGLGLVETENDFGTQGTPPTHPELLDWLATEFIARGWSMKAMHRLIVTSATYRQSSHARPELAVPDARNRLLARQNRLRLEAEVVRDAALTASGLLTRHVGGPSVFPPQPSGVYAFTQINKNWQPSTGPDRYRRGLYTYFWRSAPHPGLTVFDAPEGNSTCTRRNRSNTPLQALTLLNDQAYFELAQGLAARVLREVPQADDAARLRHAFRLLVSRPPGDFELKRLGQLLHEQRSGFAAAPPEAKLFAPPAAPAGVGALEGAAWTAVARVLLNLDEFITRE